MRVNYVQALPAGLEAMLGLEGAVHQSSLEAPLLELVKLRASQINGCGYCVDMHTKDAEAGGMDRQKLYLTVAWREAPVYSDRERAALEWCESLTLLPETGAPDDVYERVTAQFNDEEVAALTLAIVAINGWNRLAVGLRAPVGSYQVPAKAAAAP